MKNLNLYLILLLLNIGCLVLSMDRPTEEGQEKAQEITRKLELADLPKELKAMLLMQLYPEKELLKLNTEEKNEGKDIVHEALTALARFLGTVAKFSLTSKENFKIAEEVKKLIIEKLSQLSSFAKTRAMYSLTNKFYDNFFEIAKLLLAAGASPIEIPESVKKGIPSHNFQNLLDSAIFSGNLSLIKLLIEYGAPVNREHLKQARMKRQGNPEVFLFFNKYIKR